MTPLLNRIKILLYIALLLGILQGVQPQSKEGQLEWTYDGLKGPSNWGKISKNYEACAKGQYQSPVNLKTSTLVRKLNAPELQMNTFTKMDVITTNHTVQWSPVNDGTSRFLQINDMRYSLAQFHVHTPSEHWVDDKFFDGEVHFVHQTNDGKLAVLGVFFEGTAEENTKWTSILRTAPQSGETKAVDLILETEEIKRVFSQGYYQYSGSLTTPPCTEGVSWYVAAEPIRLSSSQIKALSNIIGFSARLPMYNMDADKQSGQSTPIGANTNASGDYMQPGSIALVFTFVTFALSMA